MNEWDLIIVGAGPAGSAAALQLARRHPSLAARTLILEQAAFPRPKLCGGGVTHHADNLLRYLGVWPDVPSFPVHHARLKFEELEFTIRWRNAFRIVRREEFDAALAREAQGRGVRLCEGVAVRELASEAQGVTLFTNAGDYRAKVVIGADGANSVIRQKLGLVRGDRISRLMEILTPLDSGRSREFQEHTAVFDFTPVLRGVQGYYWDFPSIERGAPTMNRGLYDNRVRPDRPRAELKPIFADALAERQVHLDDYKLKGHPERWFDAAVRHSAPRIILAGDAAGVEPLVGEGISHALNYGIVAADAAARAFAREDYSFRDYDRRLAWSALGRRLVLRRLAAHIFYGYRSRGQYRLLWHLFRAVFGA